MSSNIFHEEPSGSVEMTALVGESEEEKESRRLLYCHVLATSLDAFWVLCFNVNVEHQIGEKELDIPVQHSTNLLFAANIAGSLAIVFNLYFSLNRWLNLEEKRKCCLELKALEEKKKTQALNEIEEQRRAELERITNGETELSEHEKRTYKSLLGEIPSFIVLYGAIFLDGFRALGTHKAFNSISKSMLPAVGTDFVSVLFIAVSVIRLGYSMYRYQGAEEDLIHAQAARDEIVIELLNKVKVSGETDKAPFVSGFYKDSTEEVKQQFMAEVFGIGETTPSWLGNLLQAELNKDKNTRQKLFSCHIKVHERQAILEQEASSIAHSAASLTFMVLLSFYPPIFAISIAALVTMLIIRMTHDWAQNSKHQEEVKAIKAAGTRQGLFYKSSVENRGNEEKDSEEESEGEEASLIRAHRNGSK